MSENTIEQKIKEAIKDGLSNHTGEWFNGFIVPGLNLTEEQLRDLLFYIVKAKRLNKNIKDLIINLIHTEREEAIEKTEKKYAEIFNWLLGESDDFPRSEPGKRYGFRTELRQRLSLIGEKGADK